MPELGAQGAGCCSGGLGSRGQLGAQEGAVEAELGGTAGLRETRRGQQGGWGTGSRQPPASIPLTWRRVLGGSGASGLVGSP